MSSALQLITVFLVLGRSLRAPGLAGLFACASMLLPAQAAANILLIQGPAQTLGTGGRTDILTVERRDEGGSPITSGDLSVDLSTDSPLGQFSTGPYRWHEWTPSLSVTIPSGASSATFYYRDGRTGTSSLAATAGGFTPGTFEVTMTPAIFADDFSTGTLFLWNDPPGQWNDDWTPSSENSNEADTAAARRGTHGLRHIDNDYQTGSGGQNSIEYHVAPFSGDYHLRFWIRLVSSNGQGNIGVTQIMREGSPDQSVLDVGFDFVTSELLLGGFDASGGYVTTVSAAAPEVGRWYLVEVAAENLGTASGRRRLWIDGTLEAQREGIDWQDLKFSYQVLGQPWAQDRRFLGTIDFDDVRASTLPMASRLSLAGPAEAGVGECVAVTLSLVATASQAVAPAPYDVTAALDVVGADAFADADCAVSATTATVGTGTTQTTVYVRADATGTVGIEASHLDFMPADMEIDVAVGPADHLSFAVQPTDTQAGAEFSPVVEVSVHDVNGARVTTGSHAITIDLIDAGDAELSGTLIRTTEDGIARFEGLWIDLAGEEYRLTATAEDLTGAQSDTFGISPGDPFRVIFEQPPTDAEAGVVIDPPVTVGAEDVHGNRVYTNGLSITLDIDQGPAEAILSGTTGQDTASGVATFSNLSLDRQGSYTLEATAPGLEAASSPSFEIHVSTADRVAFVVGPSDVEAGAPIAPAVRVEIQDAGGNRVLGAAQMVSLALEGGSSEAILSGTLTVAAVDGVAEFDDLRVDRAAPGYTLVATASGLTAATSTTFDVQAGSPTSLVFTTAAHTTAAGDCSPPVVVGLRDAQDNPALAASDVDISLVSDADSTLIFSGAACDDPVSTLTLASGEMETSLRFRDTAAGEFRLTASAADLTPADQTHVIVPGAPNHLRLTPAVGRADACENETVALQVVDAFDNAVDGPANTEVTITVSSATGSPRILETTLDTTAELPAAEVAGETGTDGAAEIVVTLDDVGALTVEASSDLPGEQLAADVVFETGAADPEQTLLTSDGTMVTAGLGAISITVEPRDACGVDLGPGRAVVVESTYGSVSTPTDLGDGRYRADFTVEAGVCPDEPAWISARVDGVDVDAGVAITVTCFEVDPDSSFVLVGPDTLEACATGDVFTTVYVVPRDDEGTPLPSGREITLDGAPPDLVLGAIYTEPDAATGGTRYLVQVGSNRCDETRPRPVALRVDGVRLSTEIAITFTCPEVEAGGISATAEPDSVPADGNTPSRILVHAADRCGNAAFGRAVSLASAGAHPLTISPAESILTDAPGAPTDGTAAFDVRSDRAGRPAFEIDVDGTTAVLEDRVTFTLDDVLTLTLDPTSREVVAGQSVEVMATLESRYPEALSDVSLEVFGMGFRVIEVDGIATGEAGWQLDHLEPEGTVAVRLRGRIDVGVRAVRLGAAVTYGDVETGRRTTHAPELVLDVAPRASGPGCECTGASGYGGGGWLLALLGLVLSRRLRRP